MLDPIADEIADRARIHLDGDLDPQLAVGGDHQGPHVVGQVHQRGGLIKKEVRGFEGLHRVAALTITRVVPRDRPDGTRVGRPPAMAAAAHRSIPLEPAARPMIRPWLLSELNYGLVKSTPAIEVAVLPLGATEPHNLHLPYGTDTYQVEVVGERACASRTSAARVSCCSPRCRTAPRRTRCGSRWP